MEIKSQIQIEQEKKEKLKYLTLYNQNIKKHRFYKFKKNGPCFYIIVQGLEYADGVSRIKIGIAGCKKTASKCKKCNEEIEDPKTESFDHRLTDHRTLWPQLLVKFAVYTEDAELLEKCMKRMFSKQINPNGHEIIEGVSISEVIDQTEKYLNMFNLHNEEKAYLIEDNIDII